MTHLSILQGWLSDGIIDNDLIFNILNILFNLFLRFCASILCTHTTLLRPMLSY